MREIRIIQLAILLVATPTWAQTLYDDPKTSTGWAWAQIKAGEIADFSRRPECGGKVLDPHTEAGWDDPCRQIQPQFLIDVLTIPKWRDQLVRNWVRLRGARVTSDLDLGSTEITAELWFNASRIEGNLNLSDAHMKRILSLDGSIITGAIWAERLRIENDVLLQDQAAFQDDVILRGARVDGNLEMNTASFAKKVNASNLDVRGSLLMCDHASFAGEVDLRRAKIGGNLEICTASFVKAMDAELMDVRGSLLIGDHASFAGEVDLRRAKIGGNLEMNTASFVKAVDAELMDVHGALFIRHSSFASEVDLIAAKVAYLDLWSDTATSIDLSSLIGGELHIDGIDWRCRREPTESGTSSPQETSTTEAINHWPLGNPDWQKACGGTDELQPTLVLRNTHVETFQDSDDAWPPIMDLEGFRYDRLGGIHDTARDEMRARLPEEWADWLARDRTYSPQPYTQLASVLFAAGRRDTAEAILFAGRERERDEVWKRPDVGSWRWLTHDFTRWIWLTLFCGLAGYGIGLYTFRVLWWVVLLTVLGAAVLHYSPYAQTRGVTWRFGASLHRLLPIVELNKEFKEFFDNTAPQAGEPLKLHRWQMAFFAAIALAGWVLSFFLIAAMSGLTPK